MKNINKIGIVLSQLVDDENLYNEIMSNLTIEKVETIVNVMQNVSMPIQFTNPNLLVAFECEYKETYIDDENWIFPMGKVSTSRIAIKMLEGNVFIHVEGSEMEKTNYTVLSKIANFFPDETENAIINFAKMWVSGNLN